MGIAPDKVNQVFDRFCKAEYFLERHRLKAVYLQKYHRASWRYYRSGIEQGKGSRFWFTHPIQSKVPYSIIQNAVRSLRLNILILRT